MDETEKIFHHITDAYSLLLLNWAYKKLGDREKAEDLAQEALLQIFSGIRKSASDRIPVVNLENYVWKIARYTWCRYMRQNARYKLSVPIDDLQLREDRDLIEDFMENESQKQLILRMREKVVRLNALQREIMISFYIDGASVRQIADRYQIREATVKWHLFYTRKKLKKEITTMEHNDFVYRPRQLHMAVSGESTPNADINGIENSLTKQNLCIACYRQPMTLDELTECLGIPKAYLEYDLRWLVEKEFMTETKGKYATSFMIESPEDEQEQFAIYLKHKKALPDAIVRELTAAEEKIRDVGFYGSDREWDKLLWLLIYRFCHFLRQQTPYVREEPPVRQDGGKYFPLGFERTDYDQIEKVIDTSGWGWNGSMCSDHFWWFGLYHFGVSEIEDIIHSYTEEDRQLRELLCLLLSSDGDILAFDDNQNYLLAKLVQKGFVTLGGGKASPNFCVFTSAQYQRLEKSVFEPIAEKLQQEFVSLADDLTAYCKTKIPPHLKNYHRLFLWMALSSLDFLTTFFAFQEHLLYKPKDGHDGEFLTLMYIRES